MEKSKYRLNPIDLKDWADSTGNNIIAVLEEWKQGAVVYAWQIYDLSEIGRIMFAMWPKEDQSTTTIRILGQGRLTK